MMQAEKLGSHNHAFLIASGLLSALINGGLCWFLLMRHGLSGDLVLFTASQWLAIAGFLAFYAFHLLITSRSMLWMLGQAVIRWLRILLVALLLFVLFQHHATDLHRLRVMWLEWAMMALPLQLMLMIGLRLAIIKINTLPSNQRQAVLIGLSTDAIELARRLARSPILGVQVAGYFSHVVWPAAIANHGESLPYLGQARQAIDAIRAGQYTVVFITSQESTDDPERHELIEALYDSTASIYFLPEQPAHDGLSLQSSEIAGVPLLSLHETRILGASRYLKRSMDVLLSALALVLLSPVMVAAALAVRIDSPGPILYRQNRYGEHGRPIAICKFRSMYVDAPQEGLLRQATMDDPRVTRTGRWLRRTSIDELPQLLNVLKGSMSLVGPRPHADSHNEYYRQKIAGYMLRHTVKPGITGWAQVNGLRGETDTLEKMQQRVIYDRYYITHWSVWLDVQILFRTAAMVITGRNAY